MSIIRLVFVFLLTFFSFYIHIVGQKISAPVFTANERLTYRIRYGFIIGGRVSFYTEMKEMNDKHVFHVTLDARTTGLIDQLYRVHNRYESYFVSSTNLPEMAIRDVSEGNYTAFDETVYNQDENYVVSLKEGLVEVPAKVHDIISSLYTVRRMDFSSLKINEVTRMEMYYENKQFPMLVVYKGLETITIQSVKYRAHKFLPVFEEGKVLQNKEDMTIWFSDDKNKVPLSVKLNLKVGSYRIEIDDYKNLKFPFEAKMQ